MSVLHIHINIVTLFLTLLTSLTNKQQEFLAFNVQNEFAIQGLVVKDFLLTKLDSAQTFEQAQKLCNAKRATLFTVEPNMDMAAIFTHFAIDETWTGLLHTAVAKTLVDRSGYAPWVLINGNATTIDMAGILTLPTTETNKQRIALRKDAQTNTYHYETGTAVMTKTTICKQNLSFPYREYDVNSLVEWNSAIRSRIRIKHNKILEMQNQAKHAWSFLPTVSQAMIEKDKNRTFSGFSEIDLNMKISEDMATLSIVTPTALDFKNIKSPVEMMVLATKIDSYLEQVEDLAKRILDPFTFVPGIMSKGTVEIKRPQRYNAYRYNNVEENILRIEFYEDAFPKLNVTNWKEMWNQLSSSQYWLETLEVIKSNQFFALSLVDIIIISMEGSMLSFWVIFWIVKRIQKWLKPKPRETVQTEMPRVRQIRARPATNTVQRTPQTEILTIPTPQPGPIRETVIVNAGGCPGCHARNQTKKARKIAKIARKRNILLPTTAQAMPMYNLQDVPLYLRSSDTDLR